MHLFIKLRRILGHSIAIRKNSPHRELFVYEPMTNFPEVLASTLNLIPIFWGNMMNTCRSEVNLLKLFVFFTIYGLKSNNYSTLMHKTWIRQIKICFKSLKWLNIIQCLPECYSIFALRSNTWTLNHHFFAFSTIRLRLQRFAIGFDEESLSRTLLRWNLIFILEIN